MIKQITDNDDFKALAQLLNIAFLTVARQFNISKENCPFHNAFITADTLKSKLTPIREFYKILLKNEIIGFIAIEKSETETATFYIEKVAVHPDYRNIGYGQKLMNFATKRIIQLGGKKVSVSLIDTNTKLKEWYINQGYVEKQVKKFEHLPFNVCFMDKTLLLS